MNTLLALFVLTSTPQSGVPPYITKDIVLVIDTGYNEVADLEGKLCDYAVDLTGTGIRDKIGHGTNIASIIGRGLQPTQCIMPVKFYDNAQMALVERALIIAQEVRAKYINISAGGSDYEQTEHDLLESLLQNGVVITVAAGNENSNLKKHCTYFPACYTDLRKYKNWYVVANVHKGLLVDHSNWNEPVNAIADGHNVKAGGYTMSGTSQACAAFMSKLLGGK